MAFLVTFVRSLDIVTIRCVSFDDFHSFPFQPFNEINFRLYSIWRREYGDSVEALLILDDRISNTTPNESRGSNNQESLGCLCSGRHVDVLWKYSLTTWDLDLDLSFTLYRTMI